MTNTNTEWRVFLGAVAALVFVLVMQRAVPFLAVPASLQAFWTMGFAQSFANQSLLSIYANNIGLPSPAPIMFGLAGAYPASLLLAAGLSPADAYAATAALWLSVAFVAARRLSRSWGADGHAATLLATLWLTLPIVFAHADYSMVSFGIALLPFYFLAANRLWSLGDETASGVRFRDGVLFWVACLISVFMDGYSFMMFAVGASFLAVYRLWRVSAGRVRLALVAGPVHGSGLLVAYFLYTAYVGRSEFPMDSLDAFRGFGADLTFFFVPTATVHWFWDAVGLSMVRSRVQFFGDQSVWATTFSLPMIVIGLLAWWRTRSRVRMASGLLVLAVFGFYMALGPSLKVNSIRPEAMATQPAPSQLDSKMPVDLAVMPTGSGWLSENLPGFRNMRAAYRWTALGLFCLWALAALFISYARGRHRVAGLLLVGIVILSNMPNPRLSIFEGMANRRLFMATDETLVSSLQASVSPSERMAVLPFDNDFLAGYLAARANVHTYNIGGDKNLASAQRYWPPILLQLWMLDARFAGGVLRLLADQKVDVVLLPYIDLQKIGRRRTNPLSPFPLDFKAAMEPVVAELRRSEFLVVEELPHFALVRLAPQFLGKPTADLVYRAMVSAAPFPWVPPRSGLALVEGWNGPESQLVWSEGRAMLNLPVPKECNSCYAILKFGVLAANEETPAQIRLALGREASADRWTETLLLRRPDGHSVAIPMKGRRGLQQLTIEAPAKSPASLGMAQDDRILGMALYSVDMVNMKYPLTIADKPDARRLAFALSEGWHVPEAEHVWSEGRAAINLPLPDKCDGNECYAFLKFGVLAAAEDSPVEIRFSLAGDGNASRWARTLVANKPGGHALAVPMGGRKGLQRLMLEVVGAKSPKALGLSGDERVLGVALRSLDMISPGDYSMRIEDAGNTALLGFLLSEGWHSVEPRHVWSEGRAIMNLPVPSQCRECGVLLNFGVFAADVSHPVPVHFSLVGEGGSANPWEETLVASRQTDHSLFIPFKGKRGLQKLTISVPSATSPQSLGISGDARVLGIALRSVEIVSRPVAGSN